MQILLNLFYDVEAFEAWCLMHFDIDVTFKVLAHKFNLYPIDILCTWNALGARNSSLVDSPMSKPFYGFVSFCDINVMFMSLTSFLEKSQKCRNKY